MGKKYTLLMGAASYVLLAMTGAVSPANAQDRADNKIEEVVVTARKREENLQEVPIAIEAFSANKISELGIEDAADLAKYSAALNFDVGVLPNDTRPVIRSLTSSRGRGNVATLVDSVDVSSESLTTAGGGMTSSMRLLDLERIEVVKGPQSVLYGRSAFSGAINYVTQRPTEDFEGKVDFNLDEHDTYEGKLSLSGPLTDTLRARANIATWTTDGWYDNPNTGSDLGDGDMTGGSLALEWLASDNFTAYTRFEMSDESYGPRAQVLNSAMSNEFDPAVNPFGTGTVAPGAEQLPYEFSQANIDACADSSARVQPFYDASFIGFGPSCRPQVTGKQEAKESQIDSSADPFTGKEFKGTDVDNMRGHLELDWAFSDSMSIKSITGYGENDTTIREDFDLTNYRLLSDPAGMPPFVPPSTQFGFSARTDIEHDLTQFSQELRLTGDTGSLAWMVSGLYWEEELKTTWSDSWWLREGADRDTAEAISGLPWVDQATPNNSPSKLERDTTHWSLAATVTWSITETLNLTVEGRYLDEDIEYYGTGDSPSASTAFEDPICNFTGTPCVPGSNKVEQDHFVPRVTVDWMASDQAMLYATYSEGYKPAGIDTTDADADVTTGEYDSEELKSYELGAKTNWNVLSGMTANAAVFYYEYTDQQIGVQVDNGGFTTTQTVNAGKTEIYGLDMDARMQFTQQLSLSLGYVYTDAEFDDFNLAEIGGTAQQSANNLALAGNAEADFSGNTTPLSSEHSATLALRYEDQLTDDLSGFGEIFGIYQSKRYIDAGNRAHLPSYDIWNVSLGLEGSSWTAQLYVDNVLDDDTIRSGFLNVDYGFQPDGQSFVNASQLILPQPRTVGGRFSYRF